MGLNDTAWERLFDKYHILDKIEHQGQFAISAAQIKEFREPRLMTKFDHKINLPEIFAENHLSILPVTRGDYVISTIIDMSKKVLEHIAQKYEAVKEGVRSVMGGKVLEYEAKTIKNEGLYEGRKEGRKEGRLEMLFDLVRDNLLSLQEAISRAGLPEEVFLKKMNEYKM